MHSVEWAPSRPALSAVLGTRCLVDRAAEKWPRAWKIILIRTDNPDWKDLAADWYPPDLTPELIEKWVARIAPVTEQLILSFIGEHVLDLPKSY
jgi:hypothetical protein